MAKVKGDVLERVFSLLCFFDQRGNGVAEEALVLRLRVELLARELDDLGRRVVARARELD